MMNEENVDKMLKQALSPVIPDEELNQKLKRKMEGNSVKNEFFTRQICAEGTNFAGSGKGKDIKMKQFKLKKVIILAAACCLMIGTVSIASSGIISYVGGHSSANGEKDFTKLEKLENEAGFNIKALENYENGYTFSQMVICDMADYDENDNEVAKYKGISIEYEKEGEAGLTIDAEEEIHVHHEDEREPDDTLTINGIEVKYFVDTYKWVPEDYELTAEDEANMERNDYFISYGTDDVSENQVSYVIWVQDGVQYIINNIYGKTEPDVLFRMAQELIMAE